MDEGMPFEPYKKQIIDFTEIYLFCKEFNTTPDKILEFKKSNNYLFNCFKSFFKGLSEVNKENGRSQNRHYSEFGKASKRT
jgi:hypothetical protein